MRTSLRGLLMPLFVATSAFACQPTMADLHALNPQAEVLEVPCRPSQFPDSVNVWAVQSGTGHIVTDEQPDELQNVARLASVFIQVTKDAPYENAEVMAERYGLSCPNMSRDEPSESESELIRDKEPCPHEVTQLNGRQNWMAEPGKPKCDMSAPAKKIQRFVYVCARPPGVGANIGRWASRDSKGHLLTNIDKVFADAVAQADIVFIFDSNAAPESVYWFVDDPARLQCPNQPPPMPYDKAKAAGRLDFMAAVDTMGKPPSSTQPAAAKGDGKTTETSSPDGKGPPLSTIETIARNMNLLSAVVNMDTSGNAKHPEGDRHGMVNGTNVGGWSFPPLQFGLSAIQVITAVGVPSKEFVLKIYTATKGGQRVIINGSDKAVLKMADDLVKEAGQYELAKAFQEISAVLPFKLGQKFTAGLESKFQAHKIFEKQAFEYFGVAKFGDDAIAKAPSVILTDVEHQAITTELNKFWKDAAKKGDKYRVSQKELRELYQRVYKDQPHWLQAIEHLLRQVP